MIALVRTEFTKAASRMRTLIIALLLVGLPTLIVVAINARRDRPRRDDGEGLFRLASQSGLLVPAAVLSATSGFLLIVIAGTFAGDSVAERRQLGQPPVLAHAARFAAPGCCSPRRSLPACSSGRQRSW